MTPITEEDPWWNALCSAVREGYGSQLGPTSQVGKPRCFSGWKIVPQIAAGGSDSKFLREVSAPRHYSLWQCERFSEAFERSASARPTTRRSSTTRTTSSSTRRSSFGASTSLRSSFLDSPTCRRTSSNRSALSDANLCREYCQQHGPMGSVFRYSIAEMIKITDSTDVTGLLRARDCSDAEVPAL